MDERLKKTPVVAIVGRTNVGKSTLFNRLIEKKKAIMSPIPGTTRDMSFGHCHWRDATMTVIDTAGLDLTSDEATEESLKKQAKLAMDKADAILFLTDAEGVSPEDMALAKFLHKSKKKVYLVANKADNPKARIAVANGNWQRLGLGDPMPLSAANGSGVGDMLDVLVADLKEAGLTAQPLPKIDMTVAIIGRPNVGKSSLLNSFAGEDRVIVSEVPHTTKEPQDTLLTIPSRDGVERHVLVIDTVGIRKRTKVGPGIEKIGVKMSLDELQRADVALMVVDATAGINAQEKRLAGVIEGMYGGVIIVVNKWDLAEEKQLGDAEDYKQYIYNQLPFYKFAQVMFISAKTGNRVGKLIAACFGVMAKSNRIIPQEKLDAFTEKMIKQHHAAFEKTDLRPRVYGIKQIGTKMPTFSVTVRKEETLQKNFLHFIENRLREEFDFEGTPIRVVGREISKRQ